MLKTNLLALFAITLTACNAPSPDVYVDPVQTALAEECGLDGVLSYESLGAEYDVSVDQLPVSEVPQEDCMQLLQRDAERQALIDTKNTVEVLTAQVAAMQASSLRFETHVFDCGELEKEVFELDISGWVTYTSFHRLSHALYSGPWSPSIVKVSREGVAEVECRFDEQYKVVVGYSY